MRQRAQERPFGMWSAGKFYTDEAEYLRARDERRERLLALLGWDSVGGEVVGE